MLKALKKLPLPAKLFFCAAIATPALIGGCMLKVNSDLSTAKSEARKAGLPITFQEFRQLLPKPSRTANAADIFREYAALYPNWNKTESEAMRLVHKKALTEEEVKHFDSLKPSLDKLSHLAAGLDKKTAVDFDREWEQGIKLQYPEYAKVKGFAQLLSVQARLKALHGDRLGALTEVQRISKIGQLIGTEPTIIAMLVAIACETIAFNMLPFVIGEKPLTNEEKTVLVKMRQILASPRPFAYYLDSEPAIVVSTVEKMNSEDSSSPKAFGSKRSLPGEFLSSSWNNACLAEYLESLTKIYKVASDRTLTPKELTNRARELDKENMASSLIDFRRMISAIFLPVICQATQSRTKQYIMRDLLDGLLGKPMAIDAFTELPFKQKALRNGVQYYSVGPDLKDNNGEIYNENGKRVSKSDDISIFIPR